MSFLPHDGLSRVGTDAWRQSATRARICEHMDFRTVQGILPYRVSARVIVFWGDGGGRQLTQNILLKTRFVFLERVVRSAGLSKQGSGTGRTAQGRQQ
jgi:hypothetical protein